METPPVEAGEDRQDDQGGNKECTSDELMMSHHPGKQWGGTGNARIPRDLLRLAQLILLRDLVDCIASS